MQKDKRFLFIILVEKSGNFKKLKLLDSFNIYFQYRTTNSNALNSLHLHIISVLRMVWLLIYLSVLKFCFVASSLLNTSAYQLLLFRTSSLVFRMEIRFLSLIFLLIFYPCMQLPFLLPLLLHTHAIMPFVNFIINVLNFNFMTLQCMSDKTRIL